MDLQLIHEKSLLFQHSSVHAEKCKLSYLSLELELGLKEKFLFFLYLANTNLKVKQKERKNTKGEKR